MSFDHLRSRQHTKYEMVFSSELTRKMKGIINFLFDVMIQEIYSSPALFLAVLNLEKYCKL